jgi:23S rRNA (uracil1939-C5)-methyltransferase
VPQAIEDAKINAEINRIENAEFYVGAAEDVVPKMYEKSKGKMKADVVVVDPPRKGCDEKLLDTLVKMEPKKIVYVSCDPATLARDLKWLGEHGYKTVKYRAVDQFGMTTHVETVALLQRDKF